MIRDRRKWDYQLQRNKRNKICSKSKYIRNNKAAGEIAFVFLR